MDDVNRLFNKITSDQDVSNWNLLKDITNAFQCVFIVGAGNHYGQTPTVSQIVPIDLDLERFKIIRPHFDYESVEDNQFENLLNKRGYPFYRQIFQDNITGHNVVFYTGFPSRYKVRKSFATSFRSAIRLDLENLTASKLVNLNDEPYTDNYRSLLESLSGNIISHYDRDFPWKFPESELLHKFPGHLEGSTYSDSMIVHPLDFFYQEFNKSNVLWLNLNQEGILEANIDSDRVVSYHGNIRHDNPKSLIPPGYTGPLNFETKKKAEQFTNVAQVIIALGYSFSHYDHDILEMLDKAKVKRFIIFDYDEENVSRQLNGYFPKSTIISRHAFLPILPNLDGLKLTDVLSNSAKYSFRKEVRA